MANWRLEIKQAFADFCAEALPGLQYFGGYNSQELNSEKEETRPELGVFFEYSSIGDGLEYLLQRDMQQAERVPVEVSLHVVFNTYNEQAQDRAFEYAEASLLAPFLYTEIVMQVLLGYWLFGDLPNRWAVGGIAIIIAVGVYLSLSPGNKKN